MGLENPLLYMDVDPVVWMAGAWAALNMLEALHRERPDLTPSQLLETTRHDIRFIAGPITPIDKTEDPPREVG